MSMNPLLWTMAEHMPSFQHGVLDSDFGLAARDFDLRSRFGVPFPRYCRPWKLNTPTAQSQLNNNKNEFQVSLDVQQFKPDEISVKVVDGSIIIEAKHEERQDEHGFVSRQFVRRYKLPENIDENVVSSSLSSDGVLIITAPKAIKSAEKERIVPIVHTNAPAIRQEANHEKENQKHPQQQETIAS